MIDPSVVFSTLSLVGEMAVGTLVSTPFGDVTCHPICLASYLDTLRSEHAYSAKTMQHKLHGLRVAFRSLGKLDQDHTHCKQTDVASLWCRKYVGPHTCTSIAQMCRQLSVPRLVLVQVLREPLVHDTCTFVHRHHEPVLRVLDHNAGECEAS
jgi:hypothetical protein